MMTSLMALETAAAAKTGLKQRETNGASALAGPLLQEVEELINDLPANQRIALMLRKYQRREYDEIAATLEISQEKARRDVHQAYRKLREQLADHLTH